MHTTILPYDKFIKQYNHNKIYILFVVYSIRRIKIYLYWHWHTYSLFFIPRYPFNGKYEKLHWTIQSLFVKWLDKWCKYSSQFVQFIDFSIWKMSWKVERKKCYIFITPFLLSFIHVNNFHFTTQNFCLSGAHNEIIQQDIIMCMSLSRFLFYTVNACLNLNQKWQP